MFLFLLLSFPLLLSHCFIVIFSLFFVIVFHHFYLTFCSPPPLSVYFLTFSFHILLVVVVNVLIIQYFFSIFNPFSRWDTLKQTFKLTLEMVEVCTLVRHHYNFIIFFEFQYQTNMNTHANEEPTPIFLAFEPHFLYLVRYFTHLPKSLHQISFALIFFLLGSLFLLYILKTFE